MPMRAAFSFASAPAARASWRFFTEDGKWYWERVGYASFPGTPAFYWQWPKLVSPLLRWKTRFAYWSLVEYPAS
jgi:hypothetical protein